VRRTARREGTGEGVEKCAYASERVYEGVQVVRGAERARVDEERGGGRGREGRGVVG
jgi:hypothetical protein